MRTSQKEPDLLPHSWLHLLVFLDHATQSSFRKIPHNANIAQFGGPGEGNIGQTMFLLTVRQVQNNHALDCLSLSLLDCPGPGQPEGQHGPNTFLGVP